MTNNTSAILWLVWSIAVCIFAAALAAHWGAFDIVKSHTEDPVLLQVQNSVTENFQNLTLDQSKDEVIEFSDGSTIRINDSLKKQIACNFRLGLWC
jgi:hypothetical protein